MITRIEGMADNHALVFARSEDGYWTAQVPPDLEGWHVLCHPAGLGCSGQQHLLRHCIADGGYNRYPVCVAGWGLSAGLDAGIQRGVGRGILCRLGGMLDGWANNPADAGRA